MDKLFTEMTLEKQGDKLLFVASDETADRHGDSIPVSSWDLRNFKKAPRLLVDHYHSVEKIVGKAKNIRVEKGGTKKRLVFEAVLHDFTELARNVKDMISGGFLDTVSVGFIPHTPEEKKKGVNKLDGRNELIEISFVTVPANPNATMIKNLLDKQEEKETGNKIEDFLEPEYKGEVTVKQSHIQNLVFSKKAFEKKDAIKWASDHSFKSENIEETQNSYRLEQFKADDCIEGSERTLSLEKGIKSIVCKIQKAVDNSETTGQDNNNCSIIKNEPVEIEKQIETQSKAEKKQIGRSLSSEVRRAKVAHQALKEASKEINFALHSINKLK